MVTLLIALALAVLVLGVVTSPWRRSAQTADTAAEERLTAAAADVADWEAARDAKYREIRDAELDRSTGKLSAADFSAVDAALRAEAIEILRELDRAQARLEKLRRRRLPSLPDAEDTTGAPDRVAEPVENRAP